MDKQQKIIVSVFAVVLALMLVTLIVVSSCVRSAVGDFVPPPFEENAVLGVPEPLPVGFGTMTVNPELVIGACAFPSLTGNSLGVYLTSHQNNTSWIKIRIYDKDKNLLGESGLLKPGEYLASVDLTVLPKDLTTLYATVLAYEPDTYYSTGSANLQFSVAQNK